MWLESLNLDTTYRIDHWRDISLHFSYIDTPILKFGGGAYFSVTQLPPEDIKDFLGGIASFIIVKEKDKPYYRFRVAAFYEDADILMLPNATGGFEGYDVDSMRFSPKAYYTKEKWLLVFDKQMAFVSQSIR